MRPYPDHIAVFALLAIATGCAHDDRMPVDGTVTLDGQPLANGAISFQPASSGTGHSGGGQITSGEFCLPAGHGLKPGKYLATVISFRTTGRTVVDPQLGKKIPEQARIKYNEAGKLNATVAAGVINRFTFHLTSAK